MNFAFAHNNINVLDSYENPGMGIYFIVDPDGYWIEMSPFKK